MAKPAAEAPTKPKRKSANIFVWMILGLLFIGLAGFSVTNFGGGVTQVGRVGDRRIGVTDYANALRAELNALSAQVGRPVFLSQAQALGIDAQVRGQLVTRAALDNEAARIGISAGDARVAAEITQVPAFQGVNGRFDPETYRFTLDRSNLRVAEFEASLREDLARQVLQGAVAGGFATPATLTDTLFAYVAERRGFTLLRLLPADLPDPLPAPTGDQLRAHYDANLAAYTRPEARRIAYATLLPDDLAPGTQVDEATLRRLYDDRIAEFVQPERRLVERLVFADTAAAQAAKARLDLGEATFEALAAERGLTLDDIDMGDVAEGDLGEAGAAVFALADPGVVGPFTSSLGPALFRMNGVLSAQEITFEEAQDDLRAEAAADAARRDIAGRRDDIDDLLAGGATIEELAPEAGMAAGQVDLTPDSDDRIAGYPAFRSAAAALGEGDFPVLADLEDGGLAALQLLAVLPPEPLPFADVADRVAEDWAQAETARALATRAEAIKADVEGGASLGAYGILDVTARIARDGFVEDAPPALMQAVFAMEPGQVRVIAAGDFVGLVRLDTIEAADPADPALAPLRSAIAVQAEQALAQDAFTLFTAALTAGGGIFFDEAALAAVHAQFQ